VSVPTSQERARCPSAAWWPPDGEDHEEKRIAYVAMTRTRGDVVCASSGDCFRRLSVDRASFVGALESMTVDECIAALELDTAGIRAEATGGAAFGDVDGVSSA